MIERLLNIALKLIFFHQIAAVDSLSVPIDGIDVNDAVMGVEKSIQEISRILRVECGFRIIFLSAEFQILLN